jgi:hemolysin activation/secretion protein
MTRRFFRTHRFRRHTRFLPFVMTVFPCLCVGALVMLGLSASLRAQTYEQLAPKTPLPAPTPTLPDTSATDASAADDRILVPVLHGLVFLSSQTALQTQGMATEGLHVTDVAMLETEEFRSLATPYLGRPLSLRALNRLTRDVVLYFRQHGRPVVDVLVPEQNISKGTVQILVLEGRLGSVCTEGNKWFTSEQISSCVRARAGDFIEGGPLLDDLAWINQNPFRQVDLVFTRGKNPGETDIVLRTRDCYPLRVYTGYEDSGNALTGFDRLLAGINWGNAFGRDEQLNYQLSASPDFEKMVAHSASYVVPIPKWRHTLTVFGSYAESRPVLPGGIFALDGRAWQLSARYRVPLPVCGTVVQEFTAGVDFKRSNNNLSFGGMQIFAQENDVVQAIAAYSASRTDKHGMTSGELTLALSPGGLTAGNHTSAYSEARSFARSDYVYARIELERRTELPAGFSWVARGTAQLASANLLGSEQLGLGGASSLRGYDDHEANGDDGLILVNELHGPLLHTPLSPKAGTAPDRLDPLVFVDYGRVQSHERLPGEPYQIDLASIGLGFRYQLGTTLSARFDYGWQLENSGVSDGRRRSRAHVSVTLAY